MLCSKCKIFIRARVQINPAVYRKEHKAVKTILCKFLYLTGMYGILNIIKHTHIHNVIYNYVCILITVDKRASQVEHWYWYIREE